MFGEWVIGVFMKFESNGAITMTRLAASTRAANEQLLKQQGLIDENTAALMRYHRKIEEIRLAQLRAGTMMSGGVAAIGIGASVYAISQAADLQRQLTSIKIATGASDAQMDKVRQLAYDVSDMTAQSVAQSAGVIAVMASSGINQIKNLNPQFVTSVAKFADVQYLKSNGSTSFEEAARQAIQLAHLYQAYTPQAIAPILDKVTKLSYMMPDNLNRYVTQAGYYEPLFRRMGVPEDQSLVIGAFLDRMGLGRGKGGTSLQDFVIQSMNTLQMTSHAQAGHRAALEKLGIIDSTGANRFYKTDAKGNTTFDLFGQLEQINKALDDQTKGLQGTALTAKRAEFINDIISGFKIQGARAGFMATPEGIGQLLQMVKQLHTLPGVDQSQGLYMNTLSGQFTRAVSNLKSVMTELGWPWLTDLTGFFKTLGDKTHDLQAFLHQHKDIDKDVGATVALFTTLASVRFAIGVGKLGLAVFGFGRTIDAVTAKILGDEAKIALGSKLGAGAGVGGGLFGALDNLVLGGLGGWFLRTAGKFNGLVIKYLAEPIESLGGWIVKLGRNIGVAGAIEDKSILGLFGLLLRGLGGFASGLGAVVGGVLRLIAGPFGAVLSIFDNIPNMSGPAGFSWTALTSGGMSLDQIRDYVHKVGWNNVSPDVREHMREINVTQHVTVTVKLPPGSDAGNARRILNHVKSMAGGQHSTTTTVFGLPFGTSQ